MQSIFDKECHHFNAVMLDHTIKNRMFRAESKAKEGHFMSTNNDSTFLCIDSYQWENLN